MSIFGALAKNKALFATPPSSQAPTSAASFGASLVSSAWNAVPPFSGFCGATAANPGWPNGWGHEEVYGNTDDDTPILNPQDEANWPFFLKEMTELCPEIEIYKSSYVPQLNFCFWPNGKTDLSIGNAELAQDMYFAKGVNDAEVELSGGHCIGNCMHDGRLAIISEDGQTTYFIPHALEDYHRYAKALKIELDDRKEKEALRQKMEALSKRRDNKIKAALG